MHKGKSIKSKFSYLLIITKIMFIFSVPSHANKSTVNQNDIESKTEIAKFNVQNNQVTPGFKTLFFSQKTRAKIDEQRERYLKPVVVKKEEKLVKEKIIKKSALKNGKKQPAKKRIYIPPKVAISAVIIKPDGSTLIRVNDKYNSSPSKHIKLNDSAASSQGVPITVNGKTQIVPVGQTLLTRKQKVVDTYKLKEQARKAAMPKTQQKAVKNRLEEVRVLSGKSER